MRYRRLLDGRRQIYDFVLPGEGVGVCLRRNPLANTSTAALTAVRLIDAAPLLRQDALDECEALRPALQDQADGDERRALESDHTLGLIVSLGTAGPLILRAS